MHDGMSWRQYAFTACTYMLRILVGTLVLSISTGGLRLLLSYHCARFGMKLEYL
jgi:hypothetical protein